MRAPRSAAERLVLGRLSTVMEFAMQLRHPVPLSPRRHCVHRVAIPQSDVVGSGFADLRSFGDTAE